MLIWHWIFYSKPEFWLWFMASLTFSQGNKSYKDFNFAYFPIGLIPALDIACVKNAQCSSPVVLMTWLYFLDDFDSSWHEWGNYKCSFVFIKRTVLLAISLKQQLQKDDGNPTKWGPEVQVILNIRNPIFNWETRDNTQMIH